MIATLRYRAARRATAAAAPGRGRASAGTSTIGAKVPSKSRNTPDVPGDASHGPSRRASAGGRIRYYPVLLVVLALPARSGPMIRTRLAVVRSVALMGAVVGAGTVGLTAVAGSPT